MATSPGGLFLLHILLLLLKNRRIFFIKCFIDTVLVLLSRCMYFFEACLLMFSAVVHNFSTLHQLEYSLLLRKQYYAS